LAFSGPKRLSKAFYLSMALFGIVRPLLAFFGPQGLLWPKKAPGRALRPFKAQKGLYWPKGPRIGLFWAEKAQEGFSWPFLAK